MTTEAKALSASLERNASVKCCVCFFPHRPQPINLSYVLATNKKRKRSEPNIETHIYINCRYLHVCDLSGLTPSKPDSGVAFT